MGSHSKVGHIVEGTLLGWDFRDETDDGLLLKGPKIVISPSLYEEYLEFLSWPPLSEEGPGECQTTPVLAWTLYLYHRQETARNAFTIHTLPKRNSRLNVTIKTKAKWVKNMKVRGYQTVSL